MNWALPQFTNKFITSKRTQYTIPLCCRTFSSFSLSPFIWPLPHTVRCAPFRRDLRAAVKYEEEMREDNEHNGAWTTKKGTPSTFFKGNSFKLRRCKCVLFNPPPPFPVPHWNIHFLSFRKMQQKEQNNIKKWNVSKLFFPFSFFLFFCQGFPDGGQSGLQQMTERKKPYVLIIVGWWSHWNAVKVFCGVGTAIFSVFRTQQRSNKK